MSYVEIKNTRQQHSLTKGTAATIFAPRLTARFTPPLDTDRASSRGWSIVEESGGLLSRPKSDWSIPAMEANWPRLEHNAKRNQVNSGLHYVYKKGFESKSHIRIEGKTMASLYFQISKNE